MSNLESRVAALEQQMKSMIELGVINHEAKLMMHQHTLELESKVSELEKRIEQLDAARIRNTML